MGSESTSIVIRDIDTIAELREVEELQKNVWGIADLEVFPALAMIPMREVGGILIGAFAGQKMVGFVFGFPGHEHGELTLHSDMLAVIPEYRSHGLGYWLKLAQRERAMQKGIKKITWTFDPLQSRNAYLNFNKLGVTADRYCPDYYGQTTSFLHNIGTDRLWVKWHLDSERVLDRLRTGGSTTAPGASEIPIVLAADSNQEPVSLGQEFASSVVIEIPGEINRLKEENGDLARRWRAATRAAFTKAINAGFIVEDFYLVERNRERVGRYLLTAKTEPGV